MVNLQLQTETTESLLLAATQSLQGNMIVIFLRGAMDGMHAVIPAGDSNYASLRPQLSDSADSAIPLDGFFKLHAQLEALYPIYETGELAFIHASGSPDDSHSHFDAQDYMEHGTPGIKTTEDGWLARALLQTNLTAPLQAVAMGKSIPEVFRSSRLSAVAIDSVADYGLVHPSALLHLAIDDIHQQDDALASLSTSTFATIDALQALDADNYTPVNGAVYPNSTFGQQLQDVALLLKSDLGVHAVNVDIGGWDTHENQEAQLSGNFQQLAEGLAALYLDLGSLMQTTSIVCMTEFGRRAYENASDGTDHGHGGCMFVLGKGINGGQVLGEWPGLTESDLYGPGDLEVTTDYRTVLAELLIKRHGYQDLSMVFPDFELPSFVGLL